MLNQSNNYPPKTSPLHRNSPQKKVKVIFAIVGDEIRDSKDHWSDEVFVAELQRREDAYLSGAAKTYTLEQSVSRAQQSIKKKKKVSVQTQTS